VPGHRHRQRSGSLKRNPGGSVADPAAEYRQVPAPDHHVGAQARLISRISEEQPFGFLAAVHIEHRQAADGSLVIVAAQASGTQNRIPEGQLVLPVGVHECLVLAKPGSVRVILAVIIQAKSELPGRS